MLNDDLLTAVRDAALRVAEAQDRVEDSRREYHGAVRRLHLAGASLREIAEALGISHQRVHQMVEDAGAAAERKPERAPARVCSFCRAEKTEPASLVTGPGVAICRSCVALSAEAITAADGLDLPGAAVPSAVPLCCSSCGRSAAEARLVTGPGMRLCDRCVELSSDIVDAYLG